MENEWLFSTGNELCDVRTVGVLVKDNMILLQREKDGNEYALPGGHIKFGETLENGLIREFKEETGADITCNRLIWTEECFWEWKNKKAHSFAFYFIISLCEDKSILDSAEFVSQKDNCDVLLGWFPIDKIKDIIIYPEFIKHKLFDIKDYPEHFVSR